MCCVAVTVLWTGCCLYLQSSTFTSSIVAVCTVLLQPVKAEIQFRVQPAYYELAGKITAALTNAINVGHSEWGMLGMEGGREGGGGNCCTGMARSGTGLQQSNW